MANSLTLFNFTPKQSGNYNSPVPDQLVGKIINKKFIGINRIDIDYLNSSINNYSFISDNKIILILLESPHKFEYDKNNNPLGTLMNKRTFNNFCNNLSKLLFSSSLNKHLKIDETYNIVIANSVQYQCSLGKPLTKYSNKLNRDDNWIDCYNNGCNQDLISRIKLIKPYIIVNLCTRGIKNLQSILCKDLFPFCINNSIYYSCGSHPCRWTNSINAYIL